MKITKKTTLLAREVPLFEDEALGIKVLKIEPDTGSTLKVDGNWVFVGSGLKVGAPGFSPNDAGCSVSKKTGGEPIADSGLALVASGGGMRLLLTPSFDAEAIEPGEYEVQVSLHTVDEQGCESRVCILSFTAVK